MRILYCNKYNFAFSGTEVYLFELMDLMRAHGHEVALFSMADSRGDATKYDQHFVPAIDFKGGGFGLTSTAARAARALYSREARRKLRAMVKAFRPDVAHVRNIYHHLSPSILWEFKELGIPVVYHLNDFKLLCPSYNMVAHGRACERCRGGKFWNVVTEGCYSGPFGATLVLAAEAYLHKWLRTYEHCIARFLAPSRFVKDKLIENGWDAQKIDVLPHFQKLPADRTPGPAEDAPILYFGRLSPEKGLSDLVRAMRSLPYVSLKIAGKGPQQAELENLTRELDLNNVEFVGQVTGTQLDRLIQSSRFTVLPTQAYETLGKSILESYAQGRAVVASDLGSRRELVHEGETGVLYPRRRRGATGRRNLVSDRTARAGCDDGRGRTRTGGRTTFAREPLHCTLQTVRATGALAGKGRWHKDQGALKDRFARGVDWRAWSHFQVQRNRNLL